MASSKQQIQTAFHEQAKACRNLGSSFTGRLCELFAERQISAGPVARTLYGWQGDTSISGGAVPLRLAGALHALVLEERSDALIAVYPPHHETLDDAIWTVLDSALAEYADFILRRLQSSPQTNEVRRSGVLLPGFLTLASLTGLPLVLSEIGASTGPNLFCDWFGWLGAQQDRRML